MSTTYYMDSINHSQKLNNSKFYYNKLNNFKLKNLLSFNLINLKLISLCFIWYLTSVISSSTTKEILKDFKYPVTLTEIQFVMNGLLCLFLLFSVKILNKSFSLNFNKKFPDGTFPPSLSTNSNYSIIKNFLYPTKLILKTTIPMGMFQFIGQIASHNSTSIIPVSLVHTIKALSPLTTVLIYRFLFKKKFSMKTYLTLLPLVTGVMLCCTRNDNLNLSNTLFYKGSLFAFISMLIFVSQNIFAKRILTWDDKDDSSNNDNDDVDRRAKAFLNRFNWKITRAESATSTPILPMSMSPPESPNSSSSNLSIFKFFSPSSSSSDSKLSTASELPDLTNYDNIKDLKQHGQDKKLDKISVLFYCSIVGFILTLPFYLISEFNNSSLSILEIDSEILNLILIYGVSHFIQSLMAFQILGMVSPVNYSIANILKRIIIISCSILIEGITLNIQQYIGLSLTFIGLYCYDKWGVQRK